MIVVVKLFAGASQAMEADHVRIQLPATATVSELRKCLSFEFPQLKSILVQSMIAVDESYANDDVILSESAEIAIIPPVSGG